MRATLTVIALVAAPLAIACGGAQSSDEAETDPLALIAPEELYRRGVALSAAEDYVRAEQYLAAAIDRGYPEEQALPALLAACIEGSRLAAAIRYAEPYLARRPSHWPLRLLIASIRMALGQPARARDELMQVLADAPAEDEPAQAHYLLGVLHRDSLQDESRAARYFLRYLELEPEGGHAPEARMALARRERGVPMRVEGGMPEPLPARPDGRGEPPNEPDAAGEDAPAEPTPPEPSLEAPTTPEDGEPS